MRQKKHAPTIALALFTATGIACYGGDTESADPPADADAVAAEAAAPDMPMGHVNPNLGTSEELAGVSGMTPEAVAAVEAGRPYLRMADLHVVMADAIGDEAASAAYESLWLPINLNDVTNDEVLLIPGVGDRMAHEFEEYRPYEDMDEFRREMGKYVDEDEVARLESYVYLPLDLNSATREDIMAVPGMSERMAHEFEEYRPYTDLEQFRREMGKYVDENEVARLERYVIIN